MYNVTAKYQVEVPLILIDREEVLKLDPIKQTTSIGDVILYPPGSKELKPLSYVEPKKGAIRSEFKKDSYADTLWIDVETGIISGPSRDEIMSKLSALDSEMGEVVHRFLRLLRKKLPLATMPVPLRLEYNVDMEDSQRNICSISTVPHNAVVPESKTAYLNKEKWEQLQQEMHSGADTELWEGFIADAKVALIEDNLAQATIYAAVACEIFIKEYTNISAREARKYLNKRKLEINDYYDLVLQHVKGRSLRIEQPRMYDLLKNLIKERNNIMHEGKLSLAKGNISQLKESVQKAGQIIAWVCGL